MLLLLFAVTVSSRVAPGAEPATRRARRAGTLWTARTLLLVMLVLVAVVEDLCAVPLPAPDSVSRARGSDGAPSALCVPAGCILDQQSQYSQPCQGPDHDHRLASNAQSE